MGEQHSLASRITFACIATAAGFQAIQQALKDAPDVVERTPVPDLNAGSWNYLPIILVSVAVLFWIGQRLYNRRAPMPSGSGVPEGRGVEQVPNSPVQQPVGTARAFVPSALGAEIQQALEGHMTSAQFNGLLRPHANRWVRLRGYVSNVVPHGDSIHLLYRPSLETGVMHSIFFNVDQEPFLERLKRNEPIVFDVKIVVSGSSASLEHAELV